MHDNKTSAIKYFMFDGTEKVVIVWWADSCEDEWIAMILLT